MALKVELIVGSTTLDVTNNLEYKTLATGGFGLPPLERLLESGPLQDGATDLGFRLKPRVLNLILTMTDSDEAGYFAKRRFMGRLLKPRTTPIYLRFTYPDGTAFQIDTFYQEGYSLNSADGFGPYGHKLPLSLLAPNPLWYNPEQQVFLYGVGAGSGGFTFPLSFPVSFGGSTVNQTQTITYDGDYQTSPIIEIYGPITNPVITNLTTGEVLDFTGTTIGAGDYYTVDTRYGNIAVTEDDGTNRIDKLVGNSNLSGFKLLADPDAPNGLNDIQVTGTSANANTQIYIRYYEQYLAV